MTTIPPITVTSIVGARPQFIKLAPVCRAFANNVKEVRHRIIHTGQHYDHGMSEVFFKDLKMPKPDWNLNIGSGTQGRQTGAMIAALEENFENERPDAIIIYGDTNSTLAAAIAASKLQIPQFHVEAGLRSFDRGMPEEVNRVIADHCAEILFAPTRQAMHNLNNEGLGGRSVEVGDVMYDAVLFNVAVAGKHRYASAVPGVEPGQYAVVTIHRPVNTDRTVLSELLETLGGIASDFLPIVFPMHPRTRSRIGGSVHRRASEKLYVIEPLPYLDMLSLVQNARLVLTDSGGLQKEAAMLGTPCLTLRDSTEWTETIDIGANRLTSIADKSIREAVQATLAAEPADWSGELPKLYGDGQAADRIASTAISWIARSRNGAI